MKTKKQEINPFGKIHDYLSVNKTGDDEFPFAASDGTTTIKFATIKVGFSCNFEKPFMFKGYKCHIYLTHKQVETLFMEFLRLTKS